MGNLIGLEFRGDTTHPQDFVDALYAEVFDHHDANAEVDVFVLVQDVHANTRQDNTVPYRVLDFFVSRVGSDLLLTDTDDDFTNFKNGMDRVYDAYVERGGPLGTVEDGHEEQTVGLIFVHKHPEGYPKPGLKDDDTRAILTAIDYSYGVESLRMFNLMAVVNRGDSTPMHPGQILPVADHETDLLCMSRMTQSTLDRALDPSEKDAADTDPGTVEILTAARERGDEWQTLITNVRSIGLAIRDARRAGASLAELDAFAEEAEAAGQALARFMREIAPSAAAAAQRLLDPAIEALLEKVKELFDGVSIEGLEAMAAGPLDFSSVPTIEIDDDAPLELPQGEKPTPSSIFDLPAIDDIPDTKWEN